MLSTPSLPFLFPHFLLLNHFPTTFSPVLLLTAPMPSPFALASLNSTNSHARGSGSPISTACVINSHMSPPSLADGPGVSPLDFDTLAGHPFPISTCGAQDGIRGKKGWGLLVWVVQVPLHRS